MMSLHLIRTVAVFEMRTLLRSWFFRIFAGGAILGLGIFNTAANVTASGAPLIYRALVSSVPYFNLIILNLGQAIVAVFLGSEFLKQDRKNDTVEVIYARSISNGQYITGKALGILAVFMTLNIIILLMGIGLSFISNVTTQNIPAYFAYILLISIPTLVFILGLSFFAMVTLKNQAVTFIILTGYIALTVFYLNKKAYHLFDYIAYQVPMLYSSVTGFSSTLEIILHRGIYFLLGLALIAFTVAKLKRLPQSRGDSHFSLAAGVLLLLLASAMICKYINLNSSVRHYRQNLIQINNRYNDYPLASTDSCHIDLQHLGKTLKVSSFVLCHNSNSTTLDTLIYHLNPELKINKVLFNGKPAEYERELHILRIIPETGLAPGNSANFSVDYEGRINDNVAFADINDDEFTANPAFEVFRLDKRFAFLKKNFVCLTSESQWYPVSGAGYATDSPLRTSNEFVKYSLKVSTSKDLVPISQGREIRNDDGSVTFEPEYALPKITLLIGRYQKHSIQVDSIEYAVYSIKGSDYYHGFFDDIQDTIPDLIRDLKKEYEANIRMKYPFRRMMFAEVPIHFALDNHLYSYSSDAVQPEIFLCPEKGVLFSASDFRGRKYRLEKDMKRNNEEVLPVTIQTDMFRQFFRENFLAQRGQRFNYEDIVNWQTFSILPQYVSFYTRLDSREWPVLSIALETYISERNNPITSTIQWYEDLSAAEKINLELRNSPLEKILTEDIKPEENERNPISVSDIIQVKGLSLFNLMSSRFGSAPLDTIINSLIHEYAHRSVPFSLFSERISQQFGIDFSRTVDSWYRQTELPGFLIKNLNTYKVMVNEASRYQVRFLVSNPEDVDGIITVNVEFNDPNRQRDFWDPGFSVDFSDKIFIPARTSYETGYAFNTEPARMSLQTHISRNLPNNLIYNFSGFTETRNVPVLDTIQPVPFFSSTTESNEIISDNEDDYFNYNQAMSQAYLKSLVDRKKTDRYKYSAIWWNPPREWKAVLRSEFFGYYIRSSYYTKGGAGERTATWKAALPARGMYDIYYHVNKVNVGWSRNNRATDYNFSIYHDQGVDKINYSTENIDAGWQYIGTWYISSDTARVDVSNQSNGSSVFADAIKWVLNK